jgi:hypothetical protein
MLRIGFLTCVQRNDIFPNYDTVSKGEGIFNNFLFLPLPLRRGLR